MHFEFSIGPEWKGLRYITTRSTSIWISNLPQRSYHRRAPCNRQTQSACAIPSLKGARPRSKASSFLYTLTHSVQLLLRLHQASHRRLPLESVSQRLPQHCPTRRQGHRRGERGVGPAVDERDDSPAQRARRRWWIRSRSISITYISMCCCTLFLAIVQGMFCASIHCNCRAAR